MGSAAEHCEKSGIYQNSGDLQNFRHPKPTILIVNNDREGVSTFIGIAGKSCSFRGIFFDNESMHSNVGAAVLQFRKPAPERFPQIEELPVFPVRLKTSERGGRVTASILASLPNAFIKPFASIVYPIMACFNSLSPMRPVTNFSSCEPTVSPIAVSHTCQQVLPSGSSERGSHDGCLSCRWRKKKCKPTEAAITPSPICPCIDCAKFNIRCDGCGADRPTVSNRLLQCTRHTLIPFPSGQRPRQSSPQCVKTLDRKQS